MTTKLLTFVTFLGLSNLTFGQDDPKVLADKIMVKAKLIYELEKAAWTTGDLIAKTTDPNLSKVESYVSYKTDSAVHCVFYSKNDTILFDYSFKNIDKEPILTMTLRPADNNEITLIKIKRSIKSKLLNKELKQAKKDKNTTFNFIPIIIDNQPACYLLNAINDNSQMILGRDYLVQLDKDLNITDVKGNHKSTQFISFDTPAKAFFHTHVKLDTFFETEIATLMLYKPYLKTIEFIVMTQKFTSNWSNATNTLTIK